MNFKITTRDDLEMAEALLKGAYRSEGGNPRRPAAFGRRGKVVKGRARTTRLLTRVLARGNHVTQTPAGIVAKREVAAEMGAPRFVAPQAPRRS